MSHKSLIFVGCAHLVFFICAHAPVYAQQDEASVQYERIERADPRAVLIAMDWLSEAVVKPNDDEFRPKTLAAVATVRDFRVDEAGPMLVSLYRETTIQDTRDNIVLAATTIRTPQSKKFLQSIRDDQTISKDSRVRVLGALFALGDESAREPFTALVREWVRYMDKDGLRDREGMDVVSFVLETLDDERLIKKMEGFHRTGKTTSSWLVGFTMHFMRANRMSVDENFQVISDREKPGVGWRLYAALEAIGANGDLDAIPRLQKISPTVVPGTQPSDKPRYVFTDKRDEAIKTIQRRHWRELLKAPSTQPSR